MHVRPFSGLVPASNAAAAALVAPPHQDPSSSAAAAAAAGEAFLGPAPPAAPSAAAARAARGPAAHAAARAALARLTADPPALTPAPSPALYLYRQTPAGGGAPQTGVVGLVSAADYAARVIKPHEATRPQREHDRTRLALALSAHTAPVFLAHRPAPAVAAATAAARAAAGPPAYHVTTADGTAHAVWRVPPAAGAALARAFRAAVPAAYIADGHHRVASAARVARARAGGAAGDDTPASCFPAVLFPADQLTVLPYSRVVADLRGASPAAFLAALARAAGGGGGGGGGSVAALPAAPAHPPPAAGTVYVFVAGGGWHALALGGRARPGVAARLDCARLQDAVLAPLLGIDDPRTDGRVECVGGGAGAAELEAMVRARGDGAAFFMCPVTVDQLMEVADAGELMPPKSTWFAPKLASGFFVHTF